MTGDIYLQSILIAKGEDMAAASTEGTDGEYSKDQYRVGSIVH